MALSEHAPRALITGAARRIGAALAERLHAAGWDLILHYRDSEAEARQLAETLERRRAGSVSCRRADLAEPDALAALCDELKQGGRLDALINNAAVFAATPIGRQGGEAQMRQTLEVNALAPLLLCHHLAPLLRASPGHVLNLLDRVPTRPGFVAYDMSKAALAAMTRTLAAEMAPVAVNGLCLGNALPVIGSDGEATPAHRRNLKRVADRALELLSADPAPTGQLIEVPDG